MKWKLKPNFQNFINQKAELPHYHLKTNKQAIWISKTINSEESKDTLFQKTPLGVNCI